MLFYTFKLNTKL